MEFELYAIISGHSSVMVISNVDIWLADSEQTKQRKLSGSNEWLLASVKHHQLLRFILWPHFLLCRPVLTLCHISTSAWRSQTLPPQFQRFKKRKDTEANGRTWSFQHHLPHTPRAWPSAHRTRQHQNFSSGLKSPCRWATPSCCSSRETHRHADYLRKINQRLQQRRVWIVAEANRNCTIPPSNDLIQFLFVCFF